MESLIVVSPPQTGNDGWPHPTVLTVCKLPGMAEVWTVDGVQTVALLIYDDENGGLGPIDIVTSPGNISVTAAKRLRRLVTGIDAEADPAEIAIPTDNTADPASVTYDLVSQARHGVIAANVLITDGADFVVTVDREAESHYEIIMNADHVRETLTGDRSSIVPVDDMNIGIQVTDAYTAEYLGVRTENAQVNAERITSIGTTFIGRFSPVPLGDYSAGPNHVLPTSGTTRHASGLSTHTFLKSVHMIDYNEAALKEVADSMVALANEERLPAHGEAIRVRFEMPLGSEINGTEKGSN